MKNFSAKTADFDSISISGEAPVVQSDLGTAPNQIPLNKDLGTLAYMDSSGVEDINADTIELREIAAEMSETAVDVFVYDTRKDSDGGAWRSRTSHTSWYNEELNTATRGNRREFPAVAVIVAESGNVKKLKIYDGDDPDLPLWMSFEASGLGSALGRSSSAILGISSVYMLNGLLCVTGLGSANNTEALCQISFIDDAFWQYHTYGAGDAGISERNKVHPVTDGYRGRVDYPMQNSPSYHDVAMTVLPNAPIDDNTGLPIPTIAVATDRGVSVIKDDGSVVDITSTKAVNDVELVHFDKAGRLYFAAQSSSSVTDVYQYCRYTIPSADITTNVYADNSDAAYYPGDTSGASFQNERPNFNAQYNDGVNEDITHISSNDNGGIVGNVNGLSIFAEDYSTQGNGMVAYTTSFYNTGWMPGDIKLATLSDTKIEKIGYKNMLTDVSGWTDMSATHSISGNQITVTDDNADGVAGRIYKIISTTIGEEYVVSYDKITVGGNSSIFASIDETYGTNLGGGGINSGSQSFTFNATTTTTYIILATQSSGGGSATFDNVSVVPVGEGELITNGTFDDGTTGWTDEDGLDISVVSGSLKLERDTTEGNNSYTYQSIKTIAGKRYVFSFDITGEVNGGRSFLARVGNSINTDQLGSITLSSVGSYSFDFVATGSEHYITLVIDGGVTGNYYLIDNISVRLAEDDRSVNDNGLQVFGEIDKTPVAPGADLVAYSGFSADNYLVQPYNSDLLDIDSYAFIGWCKVGSTTTEQTFLTFKSGGESNYTTSDTWTLMGCTSDGSLFMQTMQNGTSNFLKNGIVENTGSWNHFCFIVSGSELVIYKDGVFIDSEPRTTSGSFYLNNSELRIGVRRSSSSGRIPAHATSLSLMRLSATIPTAEQIAKIYRDEKVLFQDGAQATLYGTSDAVTALAYDDSEDLLHVGTASGRSVFNGLKRVDNTDIAVTTAISANEGLVIEQ